MCSKPYFSPYHSDDGEISNAFFNRAIEVPTCLTSIPTPIEDRIRSGHLCSQNGSLLQHFYKLNFNCSNGEQWLGLEYQYFVQKSHGSGGSKLVAYIASDRKTYQYVTYEKFTIGNWEKDYAITEIDGFDEDLDDISDMFQQPGNRFYLQFAPKIALKISQPSRSEVLH